MLWLRVRQPVSQVAKSGLLQRGTVRKYASTQPQQNQQKTDDDSGDFRPPWVYTTVSVLKYTTIPLTMIYCVFLADWGEREHVFMPVSRMPAIRYGSP
ncbi:hypothetical protein BU15DRAFT_45340 [Melanogaster broomeanus]|nr:hypothetical protein BU15DRAFT_45340 [Melanogaster broomeanus]